MEESGKGLPPIPNLGRRQFLYQAALASALTACPAFFRSGVALAQADQPTLERLQAALNVFARDTMSGVASFVVPGNDLYSVTQRVATLTPGGKAAQADAFLVYTFDNFIPLPPPLGHTLASALGGPLGQIRLPLLDGTLLPLPDLLAELLSLTDTVPAANLVALLLNFTALTVNPASAIGLFPSPFSNLTWKQKAEVFERLEEPFTELLALIDTNFPGPVGEPVIAYVRMIALGTIVFAGFGSYSEWAVIDPATGRLRSRPVGWSLSEYQPFGPVEGWDEFRGYYAGRRRAIDA